MPRAHQRFGLWPRCADAGRSSRVTIAHRVSLHATMVDPRLHNVDNVLTQEQRTATIRRQYERNYGARRGHLAISIARSRSRPSPCGPTHRECESNSRTATSRSPVASCVASCHLASLHMWAYRQDHAASHPEGLRAHAIERGGADGGTRVPRDRHLARHLHHVARARRCQAIRREWKEGEARRTLLRRMSG